MSRSFRRARAARSCAAAAGAVALAISTVAVSAATADEIAGIPVYGQMPATGLRESGDPAVVSVHGVHRVDGGTVVYYSIGFPADADLDGAEPSDAMWRSLGGNLNIYAQGVEVGSHCDVAVLDQVNGFLYAPLPDAQRRPAGELCSARPFAKTTGEARVVAAAVAELPDGIDVVDVSIRGVLFPQVPVDEGLLEPFADPEGSIGPLVGMGWPTLDEAAIAASDSSERIYPLGVATQDQEAEITETLTTLELSGDVLFATGSADIDAHGQEVIARAVDQLEEKGLGGQLHVIGHTDNVGSAEFNQDLSERRAASVAAALRSQLGDAVTITTEGRSFDEPIASNDSERGKALNRRVTLDFTAGDQ